MRCDFAAGASFPVAGPLIVRREVLPNLLPPPSIAMSSVDYVPLPPPEPKPDAGPPKLTTEQESMCAKVCEHFTVDGYTFPGEEKGGLTEEEKFWLVCFPYGASTHYDANDPRNT